MPWQEENSLAAAVGTATSFLQGRNDAVDKKRQIDAETQDRALKAQAFAAQEAARQAELDNARQRLLFDKNRANLQDRKEGVGITPYPKIDDFTRAKTPKERASAAYAAANYYAGLGATDQAKTYYDLGSKIESGDLSEARVGETKARTKYIGTQDWAMRTEKPKEFYAKLQATINNNKAVLGQRYEAARQRMQAQLERGGLARGHSGAAADVALQKWLVTQDYSAAVRTTLDEYNRQYSDYDQAKRENSQNAQFNSANPNSPQLPIININGPPQMPQMPQIIMVNGQPTISQPKPTDPQNVKPVVKKPAANVTAPAGAAKPGTPWWQPIINYLHMGGSTSPTVVETRIVKGKHVNRMSDGTFTYPEGKP